MHALWRFGTAQPRPLQLVKPSTPRQVTCSAIVVPKHDHLVDSVPPMFDYEGEAENPAAPLRKVNQTGEADQLSALTSLTAELQDLMSELQTVPAAQWQSTPEGNFLLPKTDQVLKDEVSKKALSEGAQRRKQVREQRKQQTGGESEDPRMTSARVPSAPMVTDAPSTSGRATSKGSSFSVNMPGAKIRISDNTISFLGDDASDEELRQLEAQVSAAESRAAQHLQQQDEPTQAGRQQTAKLEFGDSSTSMLFPTRAAAASTPRGTSQRRTARSSQWGRKVATKAAGSSSRGRDGAAGALGKLMSSAGGVDLLSGDQEKELALLVQDCMKIEKAAEELGKELGRPPIDSELAEHLEQPLKDFSVRFRMARMAKNTMISSNTRLVISIVKKYAANANAPMADLIAEGMNGLMRGVERFDPSKGFKFSTYAHWWVRQAITRSISDQSKIIRLPSHMHEAMQKVRKVTKALEMELQRKPSPEEIAAKANISTARLQELYNAMLDTSSMDAPSADKDEGGGTLGDRIEDEDSMASDEAALHKFLKADMEAVLRTLSEKEAGVVRLRFGLVDGTEKTLEECGKYFGVTRERIRQIEAMAIRKLRARQEARSGLLREYTEGSFEEVEYAARTSSGTKKSS